MSEEVPPRGGTPHTPSPYGIKQIVVPRAGLLGPPNLR